MTGNVQKEALHVTCDHTVQQMESEHYFLPVGPRLTSPVTHPAASYLCPGCTHQCLQSRREETVVVRGLPLERAAEMDSMQLRCVLHVHPLCREEGYGQEGPAVSHSHPCTYQASTHRRPLLGPQIKHNVYRGQRTSGVPKVSDMIFDSLTGGLAVPPDRFPRMAQQLL